MVIERGGSRNVDVEEAHTIQIVVGRLSVLR